MSDPKTEPTVFTEEEITALSTFSAEYSAGLNGAGPVNRFHHAKGRDLVWTKAGLRDFFRYADPGIRKATGNRLDVHLVHANEAPEYGTGWHRHKLGFHAIYMVSGWARFMYEGKPTLVETSDFVQHAAGHHPLPLRLQPGHVLPRDRHGRHAGRHDPGRGCRAILRDPGANAVGEGLILQHRPVARPFRGRWEQDLNFTTRGGAPAYCTALSSPDSISDRRQDMNRYSFSPCALVLAALLVPGPSVTVAEPARNPNI